MAPDMETANSRRMLRRGPDADGASAGKYSTAMCKYGYCEGVFSWSVRVSHYSGSEPIVGLAKLPVVPSIAIGSDPKQFDIGWGNR